MLVMDGPAREPVVCRRKSPTPTPMTASEKVTVKRTLAALVGFGSARVMETTLGAGSTEVGSLRTKTSLTPFVSPLTREDIPESKVRKRPSADRDGLKGDS